MKKRIALGLLILAGCNPLNVTPDEKRWASLSGSDVYVTKGYSTIIHSSPSCSEIKGDVIKAKIDGDRVVDANGVALNSGREKPPFCVCVR